MWQRKEGIDTIASIENVCLQNESIGGGALSTEHFVVRTEPPGDGSESNIFRAFSYLLGGSTRPWRRLLARSTEMSIWGLILMVSLGAVTQLVSRDLFMDYLAFSKRSVVNLLFIYVTWIPVEACFLSGLGTTPVKWCFGMSVKARDGTNPSINASLLRSVLVCALGNAGGIPIAVAIARFFGYLRLTAEGVSYWDVASDTTVHHRRWNVFRYLGCALLFIAASLVYFQVKGHLLAWQVPELIELGAFSTE